MDSPESRVETQERLYSSAKLARSEDEELWRRQRKYYDGEHESAKAISAQYEAAGVRFAAATTTDAYLHIETQLVPEVPNFEFNGRDNDSDESRAKQREYCVKYVLENNRVQDFNMYLERCVNIDGNAFVKVYYDADMITETMSGSGDIRVMAIDAFSIYPDPSALRLSDCEYLIYKYRLHVNKAKRLYGENVKKLKHNPKEVFTTTSDDSDKSTETSPEDTCEVREYWFKHVEDGTYTDKWKDSDGIVHTEKRRYSAGDIGCSIQINGFEVKYIPCYWNNTREQNKHFPFVHVYKTASIQKLWAIGEIERTRLLIDAADRELIYAQLNRAFQAGDAVVVNEMALVDGRLDSIVPGQIIYTNGADPAPVKRLGGLNTMAEGLQNMTAIQRQIERTLSNFDVGRGEQTSRGTTATEVMILQQQTQSKLGVKNSDKLTAWERIIELVDWSCLEFYDEDKLVFIGVDGRQSIPMQEENMDETQGNIYFTYNSTNIRKKYKNEVIDLADELDDEGNPILEDIPMLDENGQPMMSPPSFMGLRPPQPMTQQVVKQSMQVVQEASYYYPRVDCTITATDGARQGKAFTTAMLEALIKTPVTPDNYKIVVALIKQLDLPNSTELCDYYEKTYNVMPQLVQENEQLKQTLSQIAEEFRQTEDMKAKQRQRPQQQQQRPQQQIATPFPQANIGGAEQLNLPQQAPNIPPMG